MYAFEFENVSFAYPMLVVSSISFAAFRNWKPLIVTTIYPLYDFTKQIVGDRADIVLLVPPGAEPYYREPAPTDILTIKKTTVFIYNGADNYISEMKMNLTNLKYALGIAQ